MVKKLTYASIVFVVLLVAVWLILQFGNPQWNRYVYMYQAYVYPKYEFHQPQDVMKGLVTHDEIPEDYSGEWKDYYANGKLRQCHTVQEGLRFIDAFDSCWQTESFRLNMNFEGESRYYYESGHLHFEIKGHLNKEKSTIRHAFYTSEGELIRLSDYDFLRWEPFPESLMHYQFSQCDYVVGDDDAGLIWVKSPIGAEVFYDDYGIPKTIYVITHEGEKKLVFDENNKINLTEQFEEEFNDHLDNFRGDVTFPISEEEIKEWREHREEELEEQRRERNR